MHIRNKPIFALLKEKRCLLIGLVIVTYFLLSWSTSAPSPPQTASTNPIQTKNPPPVATTPAVPATSTQKPHTPQKPCRGQIYTNILTWEESFSCKDKVFIFTSSTESITEGTAAVNASLAHFDYTAENFRHHVFVYLSAWECEMFLRNNFPSLLSVYERIPQAEMKTALVRLLLLQHYGGLWVDLGTTFTAISEDFLEKNQNILLYSVSKAWGKMKYEGEIHVIDTSFVKIQSDHPIINELILHASTAIRRNNWTHCFEIAGPLAWYEHVSNNPADKPLKYNEDTTTLKFDDKTKIKICTSTCKAEKCYVTCDRANFEHALYPQNEKCENPYHAVHNVE